MTLTIVAYTDLTGNLVVVDLTSDDENEAFPQQAGFHFSHFGEVGLEPSFLNDIGFV